MNTINKISMYAVCITALCLLLPGCLQTAPRDSHSAGGEYQATTVDGVARHLLGQGQNASAPTRLTTRQIEWFENGQPKSFENAVVELGRSRPPVVTVPPAPPYGQYAVTVIGALALIGGAVLAFKAWPKIGGTIAAGGFVVLVIGLTAGSYGWAWALLAAALCAGAVCALYSGYKSGEARS